MSSQQPDIESLLRMALKPVEPPDSLSEKLEEDLQRIVDISTDEIDSWQADALHDPRTWVKPAAAVAVGTVLHHARERTRCSVHALLTIAEEVGLYGAALAVESGLLSRQATVISLETSPALNPTQFHAGCIVRAGDRKTVFTPEITERLTDMSVRCGIAHQVRLMDGGTCEATVFQRAGFRTGAICVALGNPHNQGPSLSCAPEYVSESDTLAMLALAVAFSEDRVGPTSRRFSLEDLTKKAGEQWQMRRGPNFSSDKHDCSPTT